MMTPSGVRPSLRFRRSGVRRRPELVILVWALALVLPLALGRVAFADDTQKSNEAGPTAGMLGPLDLVKSSVSRVRAIIPPWLVGDTGSEDRRTEIRRVAHDLFDFDEMARRPLGRHGNGLTPPEQAEFRRLFTNVVEQFYVRAVEAYAGQTLVFQGETVTGTCSRMIMTHGPGIAIKMRTDRPRYTQSRGAVESPRAPELAPSTRERLTAALLVVMTSSRRQ